MNLPSFEVKSDVSLYNNETISKNWKLSFRRKKKAVIIFKGKEETIISDSTWDSSKQAIVVSSIKDWMKMKRMHLLSRQVKSKQAFISTSYFEHLFEYVKLHWLTWWVVGFWQNYEVIVHIERGLFVFAQIDINFVKGSRNVSIAWIQHLAEKRAKIERKSMKTKIVSFLRMDIVRMHWDY